ncbi:YfhO family protein [Candidatus Roizmanbacteria bacterium]|nr:YfhO family protein [Candidatus Roizmanbacteria bacterium]
MKWKYPLLIGSLIFFFYGGLFFLLRNVLLFTPDFGESDAYHLGLSLKYLLFTSLHEGHLPFWTNALQGGFPIFAESQIAALFIPNVVVLLLPQFSTAYTALFVFTLASFTIGMYLLLRGYSVPRLIALILGVIFTFSGVISLHWVHLNLIQTFSVIPFLFFAVQKWVDTRKIRWLFAVSFLVFQLICAGFVQVAFIGLLAGMFWFGSIWFSQIKQGTLKLSILFHLFVAGVVGFLLSFPQILPAVTLSHFSSRSVGLDYQTATSFPLTFSHLLSFLYPYPFGNPVVGTYPPFSQDWGIFWENTPYLSLPFFFMLATLAFLLRKKLNHIPYLGRTLVFISLFILMALGKSSPLYFLFNFPPFNFFRTPSRFLLGAVFFLIILAGLALKTLVQEKKIPHVGKTITYILLFLTMGELVRFSFQYNLFVPTSKVLQPPILASHIKDHQYLTLGQLEAWNTVFLTKGWQSNQEVEKYLYLKNYLYPDSNLLYAGRTMGINTGGMKLRRIGYLNSLFEGYLATSGATLTTDPKFAKLLSLYDIETIISSKPIATDSFHLVQKVDRYSMPIYLYQQPIDGPGWYIPDHITTIAYTSDFEQVYADQGLSESVGLVEQGVSQQQVTQAKVKEKKHSDYQKEFVWQVNAPVVAALKTNYYPDWKLYIDGKRTPTFPINLVHTGFHLPSGTHQVVLRYENDDFKKGVLIAGFALLFLGGYTFIVALRSRTSSPPARSRQRR